jgi:hypothetical protein
MNARSRCVLLAVALPAALGACTSASGGASPRGGEAIAKTEAPLDLEAIERIQQLKARYQRCVDTRDLPCLEGVFAPDAEAHFKGGDYDIHLRGWNEIERFYESAFTPTRFGMHHSHHPEIEVHGDSATGTWYLQDIFINLEDNTTLRGSALYHDEYVKIDGEWRIRYTTYRRLWEEIEPRSDKIRLTVRPIQ